MNEEQLIEEIMDIGARSANGILVAFQGRHPEVSESDAETLVASAIDEETEFNLDEVDTLLRNADQDLSLTDLNEAVTYSDIEDFLGWNDSDLQEKYEDDVDDGNRSVVSQWSDLSYPEQVQYALKFVKQMKYDYVILDDGRIVEY